MRLHWFCFIALCDWLTKPALSANEKQNHNQSRVARAHFPALGAGCMELLQILIGSLSCLRLLWLISVLTLVLVLQHSSENRCTWWVSYKLPKCMRHCTSPYSRAFYPLLLLLKFLEEYHYVGNLDSLWKRGGRGRGVLYLTDFLPPAILRKALFHWESVNNFTTGCSSSLRKTGFYLCRDLCDRLHFVCVKIQPLPISSQHETRDNNGTITRPDFRFHCGNDWGVLAKVCFNLYAGKPKEKTKTLPIHFAVIHTFQLFNCLLPNFLCSKLRRHEERVRKFSCLMTVGCYSLVQEKYHKLIFTDHPRQILG